MDDGHLRFTFRKHFRAVLRACNQAIQFSNRGGRITVALGCKLAIRSGVWSGMRIYGRIRLSASASASTANWAAWVEA
jgi:hypothetical protein